MVWLTLAARITVHGLHGNNCDSVSQVHSTQNILTFKSGYTGAGSGGRVGLVKSINCKITPSAAIAQGVQLTVATLSNDFRPKAFTSAFAIAENVICYCDLSNNGDILVRPTTGIVDAGKNIWLRAVYI